MQRRHHIVRFPEDGDVVEEFRGPVVRVLDPVVDRRIGAEPELRAPFGRRRRLLVTLRRGGVRRNARFLERPLRRVLELPSYRRVLVAFWKPYFVEIDDDRGSTAD